MLVSWGVGSPSDKINTIWGTLASMFCNIMRHHSSCAQIKSGRYPIVNIIKEIIRTEFVTWVICQFKDIA